MPRYDKDRFHLHVAPVGGSDVDGAVEAVLGLGATRVEQDRCPGAVALLDVDGNDVCLVQR